METLKLTSLFILIYSSIINSARADFLVAKAITGILSEHFARNTRTVEVISFGKSEDVLEKVLLEKRNKIDTLSVEVSKYSTYLVIELTKPSILFFDSFDSFVAWNEHLYYQPTPRFKRQALIYIQDATLSNIQTLEWGYDGDAIDFLIHEGRKSIALVTGYMFSPSKCKTNQFVVINRFKSTVMTWENSNFYPEKYQNFHGCALKIAELRHCKHVSLLYETFASALNFKLQYFDVSEITNQDEIDLFCTIGDDTDSSFGLTMPGQRIFSEEFKIIAPYGELLTPLEKMFMPFYFEVWVAILVTLLMALCFIQIINRCTQEVQNAFFGGRNNTPTLSLASLFLCGDQRHVPRLSPARFILMMMVIWCLIIRTCYQSELFKYLQSDARKPGVKSVADIVEQNFTMYGTYDHLKFLEDYTQDRGLTRVHSKEDILNMDVVAEPENKAITMNTILGLAGVLNRNLRSGVPSIVVLDEIIRTSHYGFVYRPGCPYKQKLDRKTVQLLEGGFITRWATNVTNNGGMGIKRKAEDIGPQVLTMEHLAIGFKVWLVPLTLSVIVFVLEVSRRPCREFIRRVRDAIIARSVVLAFFEMSCNIKSQQIRAKPACAVRQTTALPPIQAKQALRVDQTPSLPVSAGLCIGPNHHIRARPVLGVVPTTLKLETLIEIDEE